MQDAAEKPARTEVEEERDLYLQLLNLGRHDEPLPFLREALGVVVNLTRAEQGYLVLLDDHDAAAQPRWWIAHNLTDEQIQDLRRSTSSGIIAEALATGQTIVTASAQRDPRFQNRQSVRTARIEAVLCVPVGDESPRGVLYLQGRTVPGPFSERDQARVELVAYHLAPLTDRLLAHDRTRQEADPTRDLRTQLRLEGVIGRSRALAAALQQVVLVAPLDVNVLLTGDTGTGKSQLARVIHDNGPRAAQPFVELNCAALPDTLLESELFGALPGAHSTATRRVDGKVAAAERGTLFLDEIGDLSLAAQAKLLQLLQARQYYPLGATSPVRADVRLIAATNQDLERAVAERRFREDLFYRLHVLAIRVPTLAERRDDIEPLAVFFCAAACQRHRLPMLTLSRPVLRALQTAEWPGNIRQLENVIEAGVIRAAGMRSREVEPEHVFGGAAGGAPCEPQSVTLQEATRRFHAQLIRDALTETGWNVTEAARRLDVARSYLHTLIRTYGIKRGDA